MEVINNESLTTYGQGALAINNLNFLFLNARSIRAGDSFDKIREHIDSLVNVHILCLVETWLQDGDNDFFAITGYKAIHHIRKTSRGGGISIYIKNSVNYLSCDLIGESVQMVTMKFQFANKYINLVTVYNPSALSIDECKDMIEPKLEKIGNENCLILGDFNIDVSKNSYQSDQYVNFLSSKGYLIVNNKITRPDSGTIIDHVITNIPRGTIEINTVSNDISDHNMIICSLRFVNVAGRADNSECPYYRTDFKMVNALLEQKLTGNDTEFGSTEKTSDYLHHHILDALEKSKVKYMWPS